LAVLYAEYSVRVIPAWDSAAVVILGRAIVQNHSIQYYDANNAQIGPYFNPHGFTVRSPSDPQPYCVFPPGTALIVALVYELTGGLNYLYLIPPVMNAVGLVAVAYLGYVLSGRWASIFAVILVGTSRVVTDFATELWSDGPSLGMLLMGIAFYANAAISQKKLSAFLSGLCLGLFILLKFVNAVFAVLVVVHMLVFINRRTNWIMAGLLGMGVLAGILGMLVYQAVAYGGPLVSAYEAWGQSRYGVPLFSLRYLFVQSPPPWNDFASNAIVAGLWKDMRWWSVLLLLGLSIDRRNPWRLLLALILLVNILVYSASVFAPRQSHNMRYMLPALAAGYIIVADVLARLMPKLRARAWQVAVAGFVSVICLGNFVARLPDLASRRQGMTDVVQNVANTAQSFPSNSVVLAYNTADLFILYSNLSVLNYRQIVASDIQTRNRIVSRAIYDLQCKGRPVYLVKDDDFMFKTIYSYLTYSPYADLSKLGV